MRRALLLAVLPLALAACGGGKKTPTTAAGGSATSAIEAAAAKTVAAGSEHLTLKATAHASGQQVVVSGAGAFDTKTHQGSLHASLAAGSISTTIDEVVAGTQLYLASPLLSAGLPAGKKWLRLDLAKLAGTAGLGLLAEQDPSQALKQLRNLKTATVVGQETIGGAQTTHYRATQPGTATYDVWVGTDGYIHRVKLVTAGAPKVDAATDLSDFGAPVHVAVPSAAESFATTKIPGLGG